MAKKENSKEEQLIEAAIKGDLEGAKQLFSDGYVDVNAEDNEGFTALRSAVNNGRIKMVGFLLLNGADVTAKNCYGKSALTIAEEKGDEEIIAMLKHAEPESIKSNELKNEMIKKFQVEGDAIRPSENIIQKGVLGSIALCVIAIVWFLVGYFTIDRLFIYPPIMFVFGLMGIFYNVFGKKKRKKKHLLE